ncbi:putative bifunctional diguanylate cyclase/phosphodiesterase [Tropicibacter oceani]|uniref:EAL domain-containing protein n=1 Tax=Tropicibacter oceani TaxID=3058420 RepID=A0ABY8QJC5_9RHOB|nr:EAL domain-containing protein [Tropicibacter oceani]WGW04101.1 EAL domain-containing protein [Tropicibacter oceani]
MQETASFSEGTLPPVWRRYLPTLLVAVVVVLASGFADHANLQFELQQERDRVRNEVAILATRLERRVNAPIRGAQVLVAALSSEPDMTPDRFAELAGPLIEKVPEIRNLAAAPNLVVTMIHPLAHNASALGLDYTRNEAQRAAVYHVRDSGEFILAGPLDLVQGGQALVGRFPVYAEVDGVHAFWGILSVVVDLPELYSNAGVSNPELDLEIAMFGRDGTGRYGPQFYGPMMSGQDAPITDHVLFPNGSWTVMAKPIAGWGSTLSIGPFRAFLAAAGLIALALVALTNYMANQRRETIAMLRQRERQLESARREVEALALHDPLTGLPNRRLLDRKLKEIAGLPYPGLMTLDLDGFKEVNDRYGHAVGDQLLSLVAERLRKVLGPDAILIRSGGDEFVVILSPEPDSETCARIDRKKLEDTANALIASMNAPIMVGTSKCRIGISAGIHQHDAAANISPEEQLIRADHAMYMAKQAGRNRYVFTAPGVPQPKSARHGSSELLEALSENQIVPFYQPQFASDGETLVGVEALARWRHADGSHSVPGDFMALAHTLKIEGEIDHRILEQAKADLEEWDKAGISVPQVSVNVSLRRLNDERLIEQIDSINVDPARITLELLESICLDEQSIQITSNIEALKKRGFRIEVDDFGTGYSSVTSLLKMRPDCFKIDRSLVQAAPYSRSNRRLLGSIAEMGHALNISVCAEGIETIEQLQTARAVGCTVFQGFLLAQPMPAPELVRYLLQMTQSSRKPLAG